MNSVQVFCASVKAAMCWIILPFTRRVTARRKSCLRCAAARWRTSAWVVCRCGVGVPTLLDVAAELQKPGRDPRDELPKPILRTDVLSIADLKPGMELTGTVRNVIDFGAFVDIGVHQDGLVHISRICSKFIKHPSEVLSVGDVVTVWVLEVDEKKKRISLTMKAPQ